MPFSLTKKTSQQPTRPPGPQGLNRPASMLSFQRAPLRFLTDLTRQYGDIAQFPLLTQPVYFLNHPDHLRYILQEHHYNYDRNMPLVSLVRLIVGNGLSTNTDQESWLRQRRLIQPAFHKQSIAAFGSLLCTETLAILERWEEQAKSGQPVNIAHEMEEVTLHIVSKAMFHRDFTRQSQLFIRSFQLAHQILGEHLRFPFPPFSLPTPRHRQFRAAIQQMDEMVFDIIRQHRQQHHHDHDLLSMLLSAVDEETGKGMSDQQIHDEVITFLAAGSETTACTLTWMWYLLSQHPTVEQRLLAELNETLAGAPPTVDDLPRLPYARMIIDETLRLYPPIWLL
ncbi:MAG: cytochrome P450, partial [Ktedonobacteraceae bacterium]|nr:cytochrome P450 [Ktedonobacteraceae bacterium]